ncbi:MAG: glycosyltransferase family 39 protein [Actinomycetota bacterium]|nr:glycosyltransferase family 39 protein [Actinomycetota bacterium]
MLGTTVVVRPPANHDTFACSRHLLGATAVLAVLGAAFLGLGLRQAWSDSLTYDEPTYISSGLVAVVAHDLSLNPEHPPLYKALAVLPALAVHPVIPPGYRHMTESDYAYRFVQAQQQAGKLRAVVFLSRVLPLLEGLAVGIVLFVLGKRLFGTAAGLLAAGLWLADPLVLGLAHLDGIDVTTTLAVVLLAWALLNALRDPAPRRLHILGIAAGSTVLADDYGFVLAVLAAMIIAFGVAPTIAIGPPGRGRWQRGLTRFVRVLVAGWVTVLVAYAVLDPASLWPAIVVPGPLVHGLRYLLAHDTQPSVGYLLGVSWRGGRWWYWPVSLAVKVPWPSLVVLVGGLLVSPWVPRQRRRQVVLIAVLPALAVIAVLTAVGRDIGVRYALPVVALWSLAASPVAALAIGEARRARWRTTAWLPAAVTVLLVGLSAAQTVRSAPHSLAWVNPLLGPSYRVVTNSSGDWGQDFYALERWSAGKRPFVVYSGTGLTLANIVGARPLIVDIKGVATSVDPTGLHGWVAASASDLTSTYPVELRWLRAYCPVEDLSGTILIYHFLAPPHLVDGPTKPAPLCPGSASSLAASSAR